MTEQHYASTILQFDIRNLTIQTFNRTILHLDLCEHAQSTYQSWSN